MLGAVVMLITLVILAHCCYCSVRAFQSPTTAYVSSSRRPQPQALTTQLYTITTSSSNKSNDKHEYWDVIVVGSGIGGLSAASLCAKYGLRTLCVEAHDHPGGVAHSFERRSSSTNSNGSTSRPFVFDSGPSLLSGMSSKGTNPLRQVLDAIGTSESINWVTYNGWMIYDTAYPIDDTRSKFRLTTGNDGIWEKAIQEKAGIESANEFIKFKQQMMCTNGLSESSTYIPPMALRGDFGAIVTMSSYLLKFLKIGTKGQLLTGAFTKSMDKYNLHDKFNRNWFDYLAFALSGLDAAHTQAAPVAYTMIDLHKEGAVLDYPMGGLDSLIQALVQGLEMKRQGDNVPGGGELRLKSRVERFLLTNDNGEAKCTGVQLSDGTKLHARKGVICNAPLWNMAKLLEDSIVTDELLVDEKSSDVVSLAVKKVRKQANAMEMSGSFMHIHLGIPSDGIPCDLDCHHSVLNLDDDITAAQNLVIVSIPTIFDPTLAPEGYHVIHAYTAANENFADWDNKLDKGYDDGKIAALTDYKRSEQYKELKNKKTEALWTALERIIPDVRERASRKGSVVEIGTPLTHRRFNRRYRGTYGPAPSDGKDVWDLPGPKTSIAGLLACGDTTFPGELIYFICMT